MTKKIFLPLFLILMVAGCSSPYPGVYANSPKSFAQPKDRMLIKSADIDIEFSSPKTLESVTQEVFEKVSNYKGYIDMSQKRSEDRTDLVAKIPSTALDSFLNQLHLTGEVVRKTVYTEDVTENYQDTQAKLTNLQTVRDRFLKLLEKAKKVEEIIKVEKEIARLQTEIDILQSRIKA